jgi:hypothetical protein
VADYIDRNILCQAYIHIEPIDFPLDKLELVKDELQLFITTRGRFFLYNEVATSVELKDGSLKVYATIAGSLFLAIGQYGDFRSGVDYLAQDTKRLADCIVSEGLYMTHSRHDNILHVEARIGVAGSLKSVVDQLELTQRELGTTEIRKSIKRLKDIQNDIDELLAKLNDPADPPYISSKLCALVKELLPDEPTPNSKKPHEPVDVGLYVDERKRIISLLEAASIEHA